MKNIKILLLPICVFASSLCNLLADVPAAVPPQLSTYQFVSDFGKYILAKSYVTIISEEPWKNAYHRESELADFEPKVEQITIDAKEMVEKNRNFNDKLDKFITEIEQAPRLAVLFRALYPKIKQGSDQAYRIAKEQTKYLEANNMINTMDQVQTIIQQFQETYGAAIDSFFEQNSGYEELKK